MMTRSGRLQNVGSGFMSSPIHTLRRANGDGGFHSLRVIRAALASAGTGAPGPTCRRHGLTCPDLEYGWVMFGA